MIECGDRNLFNKRMLPLVGDFIDGNFVLCGGFGERFKLLDDCIMVDQFQTKSFKMVEGSKREYASSVKLNDSTIWITGGESNSTEFVTVHGSSLGITLPINVEGHCMVIIDSNIVMLIGGIQDKVEYSDKTWIIDVENDFNITEGPRLIKGRKFHMCGKLKDESGNMIIVAISGSLEDSVEFLDTSQLKQWVAGTIHNVKKE